MTSLCCSWSGQNPLSAQSRLAVRPICRSGENTFAIGNPYGLDLTLTSGIVSALGRRLPTVTAREVKGMIQTDAAVTLTVQRDGQTRTVKVTVADVSQLKQG